jgi:hypothetical protein
VKVNNIIEENLAHVNHSMEPILGDFLTHFLNGNFSRCDFQDWDNYLLTHATTEEEAIGYEHIRNAYLPSLILAYNGALVFAADFLGPETLLKSLDLANVLASDTITSLADAFMASNRMSELVTSLALASRQLLKINQGIALTEKRVGMQALLQGKEAKKAKLSLARMKRRKALGKGKRGWMGENVEIWDPNKSGLVE